MRSIKSAKSKQTPFPRLAIALRCGRLSAAASWASARQHRMSRSFLAPSASSTVQNTGINFFQPVVAPVVVAPLGKHFLAESRFDLRGFYARKNGNSGPYQGSFIGSTQYLQLDYLASDKLTIHGRPLPHPIWHL